MRRPPSFMFSNGADAIDSYDARKLFEQNGWINVPYSKNIDYVKYIIINKRRFVVYIGGPSHDEMGAVVYEAFKGEDGRYRSGLETFGSVVWTTTGMKALIERVKQVE